MSIEKEKLLLIEYTNFIAGNNPKKFENKYLTKQKIPVCFVYSDFPIDDEISIGLLQGNIRTLFEEKWGLIYINSTFVKLITRLVNEASVKEHVKYDIINYQVEDNNDFLLSITKEHFLISNLEIEKVDQILFKENLEFKKTDTRGNFDYVSLKEPQESKTTIEVGELTKDTVGKDNRNDIIGEEGRNDMDEIYKDFISELEQRCNRFENDTIKRLLKQRFFYSCPENGDKLWDFLLKNNTDCAINQNVIEYLMILFSGFTDEHDIKRGELSKLLVINNDEEVTLFFQKLSFKGKSYALLIKKENKINPFEFFQISDIFANKGYILTSQNRDEQITKEMDLRRGYKLLDFLKQNQDELNLINIAQIERQVNHIIMDYSKNIATPHLWSHVLYLFSHELEDVKSIFLQTKENFLSINKDIYTYKENDYRLISMFNLKTLFTEPYFNEFNDKIYTKVFELAKKKR